MALITMSITFLHLPADDASTDDIIMEACLKTMPASSPCSCDQMLDFQSGSCLQEAFMTQAHGQQHIYILHIAI